MSDDKTRQIPIETAAEAPTAALPVTANEDLAAATTVMPETPTETLPTRMEPEEPTMPLYGNAARQPWQDQHDSNVHSNPVDSSKPSDSSESHGSPYASASAGASGSGNMQDAYDASDDTIGRRRSTGANDDLIIRPTGPSVPTIVLGALLCIVGTAVVFSGALLPWAWNWLWQWAKDPRLMVVCVIGGFGVFLIVVAAIWALAIKLRDRYAQRDMSAQTPMRQSGEQSPERQ